ncbi:MAG: hypothetical protein ABL997_08085, partial [Planctomycetota bacterium]
GAACNYAVDLHLQRTSDSSAYSELLARKGICTLAGVLLVAFRYFWPFTDFAEAPFEPRGEIAGGRGAGAPPSAATPVLGAEASKTLPVGADRIIVPPAAVLSQPFLSLEASLEASLRDSRIFATAGKAPILPDYSSQKAIEAAHLNPDRKVLTDAQYENLEHLISQQSAEENALHGEDFKLREQSFFRAIARGSFRAVPILNPPPGTALTAANINKHQARIQEQMAAVMKELSDAMGQEYVNWMSVRLAGTGPDGITQSYWIYYTRADEPQAFAAWDRVNAHGLTRRQQMQDFFASLR